MRRLMLMAGILCAATGFFENQCLADGSSINAGAIEAACATAAAAETAKFRPLTGKTKMWCAVISREGKLLAINATDTGGTPSNPMGSDAWRGSIEIAIAKAYTAVAFSSNELNVDSRAIGLLSRTDAGGAGGVGTDTGPGPLWGVGNSNPFRPPAGFGLGSDDFVGGFHHGIITFAGGQPVYTKGSGGCGTPGGVLIGAVGVSGDGVDEDDDVARGAVTGASFCLAP